MKFSQDIINSNYRITAQELTRIRVNDTWLTQSFIVSPSTLIDNWNISSLSNLSEQHCEQLINMKPEVLIIGTGTTQCFPDTSIMRIFAKHQIGLEIMNSAAACRTFNILLGEDRHVVAGVILS